MAATHGELPTRTNTSMSDEDIVGEDTGEVTNLFNQRLQAYKHTCAYLEDYVKAVEKVHKDNHKEFEKVVKTVSHPIKEAEHFETQPGGIQGMLESLRTQTQAIANSNQETAKTLNGSVLPMFERLHKEIKNKTKELTKGAGKGSKAVDKARQETQKHIELLGKNIAASGTSAGSVKANEDPYILHRGVNHRLHKQVLEENNNRSDLIEVQNSFSRFEEHIIQTFQQGMSQFLQVVTKQDQTNTTMYSQMVQNVTSIPPNFEWNSFLARKSDVLIDPNAPPRSVSNISFPGQNAHATQPLIAGALDRKGKIMKRYDTNYYVVTPSKYLHEFKTDDDVQKDPAPETSLYLPDCQIGALDGMKFAVKGKDASSKLSFSSHELQFKAHSPQDAAQWYRIISECSGNITAEKPEADDSDISSPVVAPGEHPAAGTAVHPAGTAAPVAAAQPGTTAYGTDALQPTAGAAHTVPATANPAVGTTAPHTGPAV